MEKYNIGDSIKIIKLEGFDEEKYGITLGEKYIIIDVHYKGVYIKPPVDYSRDGKRLMYYDQIQLEFSPSIRQEQKKQSIIKMAKRFFKLLVDKDVATLSDAGYLNGDLELTDEGKNALLSILFNANKPALVALAETEIADKKKSDE